MKIGHGQKDFKISSIVCPKDIHFFLVHFSVLLDVQRLSYFIPSSESGLPPQLALRVIYHFIYLATTFDFWQLEKMAPPKRCTSVITRYSRRQKRRIAENSWRNLVELICSERQVTENSDKIVAASDYNEAESVHNIRQCDTFRDSCDDLMDTCNDDVHEDNSFQHYDAEYNRSLVHQKVSENGVEYSPTVTERLADWAVTTQTTQSALDALIAVLKLENFVYTYRSQQAQRNVKDIKDLQPIHSI